MFQSICHTDPSLLKAAILDSAHEDSRIIIDLSSVHSHTDFVEKYPESSIAEHPQFNLRRLLEVSSDLMFTVDYFLLYMLRLSPEISKVQPRTFNKTIHDAFIHRNSTNITVKSLIPENLDSLVKELNKHIKLPPDCQLEDIKWGGNYIKLLKPKELYPVLHYLYESLASARANKQRATTTPKIKYISIIDTEGKLLNEAFTNALIPILFRLEEQGVYVTHNHCGYQYDYRLWEIQVRLELLK
tara:strand:+ start:71780 stop:72508 length:729 start_codon:yes stop_codon:yes gene_type:complete